MTTPKSKAKGRAPKPRADRRGRARPPKAEQIPQNDHEGGTAGKDDIVMHNDDRGDHRREDGGHGGEGIDRPALEAGEPAAGEQDDDAGGTAAHVAEEHLEDEPQPAYELHVGPSEKGRRLVIVLDADKAEVARDELNANKAEARRSFCEGAADALGDPGLAELLEWQLVAKADEIDAGVADAPRPGQTRADEVLVEEVLGACAGEPFRGTDGRPYLTLTVCDRRQTHRVGGDSLVSVLRNIYFRKAGRPIPTVSLEAAVDTLQGFAAVSEVEEPVYVRRAGHGGKVYVDLCDPTWRAVEVDADGYRVIDAVPVRFVRPSGLRPLPEPTPGGRLGDFLDLLHLDEEDRQLATAWLLGVLHPGGPYVHAVLTSEQGAGKSTKARLLKRFLSPAAAELRRPPKNEHDLAIAAGNDACLAFDNMSHVPDWLSDALCCLSTGAAFTTRTLYSDDGETVLFLKAAAVLNGVTDFVTKPDLQDRVIRINAKPITPEARRTEADIEQRFGEVWAGALGHLLEILSSLLRELPGVELPYLTRMADFTKWVTAAESALGLEKETYLGLLAKQRVDFDRLAVEATPVGAALLRHFDVMKKVGSAEWKGTPTELLKDLESGLGDARPPKGWPANAKALVDALDRLGPSLRRLGKVYERGKSGDRWVKLTFAGAAAESEAADSPAAAS